MASNCCSPNWEQELNVITKYEKQILLKFIKNIKLSFLLSETVCRCYLQFSASGGRIDSKMRFVQEKKIASEKQDNMHLTKYSSKHNSIVRPKNNVCFWSLDPS